MEKKVQVCDWRTPFSYADSVRILRITDNCKTLKIYLHAIFGTSAKEYNIIFSRYPAYRNLNESYLNAFWEYLAKKRSTHKIGWTYKIKNSGWQDELNKDFIFSSRFPRATNYVVSSEDDVIEILTDKAPVIKFIGRAAGIKHGKSRIYYR